MPNAYLTVPINFSGIGGLEGSVLAFRTKVRGVQTRPKPSDFSGIKKTILSTPHFGREVKLWVPRRRFRACKRSLNATWNSGIVRVNLPAISRPHIVPTFVCYDLSKTTSGESWKHINYRVTTPAFSD
jgi:hypothetical protein